MLRLWGIFLAVVTGSAAAFWRLNDLAPPQLELSTSQLNLEMAADAQVTRAAIRLKNVGRKDLTILGTTASCGCLKPELDRTTLAANEATELRLSIMNSAFATSTLKVDVRSDDPRNPIQTLTISIFKRGQTSLSSRQMIFQGSGRSSLPLTRRVFLTATRDELFDKISDLSATTEEEQISLKVITERERLRYVVEATLTNQAAAGSWRSVIQLRDRDGLVAETIDVDVDVPSTYLQAMPEIVLGSTDDNSTAGKLRSGTIPIRYRPPPAEHPAGRVIRAELSRELVQSLEVELKQLDEIGDVVELREKPARADTSDELHRGTVRLIIEDINASQVEVIYVPVIDGRPIRARNTGG